MSEEQNIETLARKGAQENWENTGYQNVYRDGYLACHTELVKPLVEALESMANNEGECCQRCEGNGKLWADGKAHYPSYTGDTINCGDCGGSGRIFHDLQEIASAALTLYNQTLNEKV